MPLLSSVDLHQRQLVQTIGQKYPDVGEEILAAFRAVPRHRFLHGFYERVPVEGVIWRYRSRREMTEEAWLQTVYEDRAYTIRLDASEQRFPASSSSQPSVMAAMFAALDIPAGSRVLEIGTGRLLQFDGDDVSGDASLWQDLLAIASRYRHLGLPKRRDFTFCVEAGQQFMQLNGQRWLFANVDSC